MGGFEVSHLGALGAGILSFLSPCVLPLVPPYLCFIGGVSLEQMTDDEELPPEIVRALRPAAKTREPEVRALLLQTLCLRAPGSPEAWPDWMNDMASGLGDPSSTGNIFCRAE